MSGRVAVGGKFSVPGKRHTINVAVWGEAKGWIQLAASSKSTALGGSVESVALTPSGAVHVGGHLLIGESPALLARWSSAVVGWSATATSATLGDAPQELTLDASGALVAGTGVGWYGAPLVRESATSGYGWERVGGGVALPRRTAWISALTPASNGKIAVGGAFTSAGGVATQHVALWDATQGQFSALGFGLPIEPDALANSPHSAAYAALRLRSAEPGKAGRTCITAWGAPAPATPVAPALTAKRTTITARWSAVSTGSAPSGWIAEATAAGHATRSCSAVAPLLSCTITALDAGTKYSVRLRAYAIPVGPSQRSVAVKATTKK